MWIEKQFVNYRDFQKEFSHKLDTSVLWILVQNTKDNVSVIRHSQFVFC